MNCSLEKWEAWIESMKASSPLPLLNGEAPILIQISDVGLHDMLLLTVAKKCELLQLVQNDILSLRIANSPLWQCVSFSLSRPLNDRVFQLGLKFLNPEPPSPLLCGHR
jgi:hypothetical protein